MQGSHRSVTDHFANALDQDTLVVVDFAGEVMMILPDLVRRMSAPLLLAPFRTRALAFFTMTKTCYAAHVPSELPHARPGRVNSASRKTASRTTITVRSIS